jgi:hypothetical protein
VVKKGEDARCVLDCTQYLRVIVCIANCILQTHIASVHQVWFSAECQASDGFFTCTVNFGSLIKLRSSDLSMVKNNAGPDQPVFLYIFSDPVVGSNIHQSSR